MTTIVTRAGKGSPLTNNEVDANFINLNTAKIEVVGTPTTGQFIGWNGTAWAPTSSSGTVTSVNASGGSTGLAFSGGPVTTSGTLTLGGTLAVGYGGTGATTAAGARINLGLGTAATTDASAYATAAQGAKADTAVQTVTSLDGSVAITGTTAIDLSVSVAASTNNVLVQVRNTTGATLTKGTVVYINGATGQLPTVAKAIASGDATSAQTLGMITADLANNANGNVTVIGLITGVDTSAYTDGQQLYLSGTTAGAVTATKPVAPIHMVYVGVVEHAHPSQGKIFVKVQNGYELDELHDVLITTKTSNDVISYDSASGLWKNKQLTTVLGFTPENSANRGVAGGYASLDGTGKVPSTQLPSYVDDVVEYANQASFPATGSTGIIYVALDTNKIYRWSGSAYVEISPSPGSTDSVPEGSTNLYYTTSRARSAISASGSLSYNNTTGVVSYTQPTNVSAFTNDVGYLTGITSGNVTTALGYTPANKAGDTFSGAVTFSGGINPNAVFKAEGGAEGGQFLLEKGSTGTTLSGNLVVDLVGDVLRFFDGSGTNRGAYLNIMSQGTGAGSRILTDTTLTSGNVTTALGYTPANKAGDTFTGNIVLSNGADRRVRIGSSTNYYYDLQTTGDNFQIIEAGTTPRLTISYPSGSVTAATDFRAPVFYDSQNTAYFVDPAGNSVFNSFNIGGGEVYVYGSATNALGIRTGAGGAYKYFTFDASGNFNALNGSVTAGTDMRAPIFYDSQNTAYYLNPESSSVLWETKSYYLTNITGVDTDHRFGVYFGSDRNEHYAITREAGAWSSPYPDLRIAFYTGMKFMSDSVYGGMRFYNDTAYSTQIMSISNSSDGLGAGNVYVNNSLQAGSSLRAPIFYDSNNTAYYLDAAGNSVFSNVQNGVNYTSGGGGGRLVVGPGSPYSLRQEFGSDNTGWRYGIAKNVSGTVTDLFYVQDTGPVVAIGDMRAPIFYDSNNTAYFVDPASTAGNAAYFAGGIHISGANVTGNGLILADDGDIVDMNDGYCSMRFSNGIRIRNGNRTGDPAYELNSVYGASSLENQRGFVINGNYTDGRYSTRLRKWDDGGGVPLYIQQTTGTAGSWANVASFGASNSRHAFHVDGVIYTGSDARAPVFYDANNTGYYVDPNSVSYLQTLAIETERTYLGSINNDYSSGYYHFDHTQNTPTGGYGHAHIIRLNADWNVQMFFPTSNTNEPMWLRRKQNGTYSAWRRLLQEDEWIGGKYLASDGRIYGTILYDSNDTSTYVDPNGSSWFKGNIYNWRQGPSNDTFGGLELREADGVGNGNTGATYAPGINFHWSNVGAARIYYASNGSFVLAGQSDITNNRRSLFCNEIYATGNVTAYYSDERLKTRIGNIDNALGLVSRLSGFRYVNNDLAKSFGYGGDEVQIGVSAQEVQEVLPEVVKQAAFDVDIDKPEGGSKTGENYLTVDYSRLVPLLIEAIKELNNKVEDLEAKLRSE